ncbi:MAG: OmpH family outer membrane protein [Crocinitomicaceae bacterium]|nr:OmpH family outer membrane protein [Crocinitomicaceae bacterium]
MKKFLLAIGLVLGAGSSMAQSKVAHVNSQTLLDTLPSRKVAIVKLQEFESNGVKELQEMEADFNAAVAKYQAGAADMSPVIVKIEEEKLMKKQQALQEREQSLNAEMQAYSEELNTPILGMVQKAVKVVSERMKINYVIDESVTLYFGGGLDITDEVIVELLKMDKE